MNQGTAHPHRETTHRLARRSLFAFLVTFLLARIDVFLIMSGSIPNLYLFMHGTHVHHLNYGIFLLSVTAGYAIFRRPVGRAAEATALAYGVALALTFDEFGMWVRLDGSTYWQRASIDAVGVLAAVPGLFAYAPAMKRFRPHHWWSAALLVVLVPLFFGMMIYSSQYAQQQLGPWFDQLEARQPK